MCKRIEIRIDESTGKIVGLDAEALLASELETLQDALGKTVGEVEVLKSSREYHEPHVKIKTTRR